MESFNPSLGDLYPEMSINSQFGGTSDRCFDKASQIVINIAESRNSSSIAVKTKQTQLFQLKDIYLILFQKFQEPYKNLIVIWVLIQAIVAIFEMIRWRYWVNNGLFYKRIGPTLLVTRACAMICECKAILLCSI